MSRRSTEEAKRDAIRTLDGILPEGLDRRKFLETAIATSFAGVAGCTGGGDDGDGGQSDGSTGTPASGTPTSGAESGQDTIIKNTTWRLPWKAEPDYSPPFIAQMRGFWDQRGISPPKVREGFGSSDTAKRVGTGEEVFGSGSALEAILGLGEGYDLSFYGVSRSRDGKALIWRKDRADTVADIESVMVQARPGIKATFNVFRAQTELSDSVEVSEAADRAAGAAFTSGDVDALYAFVGTVPQVEPNIDAELGVKPFYTVVPIFGYLMYFNSAWISEADDNFEYTVRVLEGISEATKWVLLHPVETVEIMRQDINQSLQTVEKSTYVNVMRSLFSHVVSPTVIENGVCYLDDQVWQNTLDLITSEFDIDAPPAEELTATDVRDEAELATMTDDEWNQVIEFSQPYYGYFQE